MFFQAARKGTNEWWMYLVGIIAVGFGYLLGQIPLFVVIAVAAAGLENTASLEEFAATLDFNAMGIDPNLGFLLALMMFVFATLALFLVIKYLHNRDFTTLINNLGAIRWSRFFYGLGVWMMLGIIYELFNYFLYPESYTFQFSLQGFIPLLIISLLFIPIQASFEELFVRGYLMQGLGLATNSRLVAILLTSAVFAGLHLMNPEIDKFGLSTMVIYYMVVAVFLAVITLLDDGLELAMGIHTATNLFGSLFVTFEGSALQTQALFRLAEPNALAMLMATIFSAILFMILASRRFKWQNWQKIYGPVSHSSAITILDEDSSKFI
ncbi:MAG: CPBP family intramembrane metalloprotease [Saprospiraceae bacterium]|nr:CPBP family intramembrane metalloprotease [Saprospiraceae bacterium]